MIKLTIIVPCYNEEESLPIFTGRLRKLPHPFLTQFLNFYLWMTAAAMVRCR